MSASSKCRAFVWGFCLLAAELFSLSAQAQQVVVYEPAPPPPPPPQRRVLEPLDRVQLGAQVGWLFGANAETFEGDVGLVGNLAYTGNLAFRLPSITTLLELSYTYFPTELEFDPFVGPSGTLTDINVHYFQIGAHQELPFGVVRPFIGFALGATYFNPEVDLYDNETYFATTLLGGVKFVATENVGVRLQARLPYTWTGTGSTIFCSGGGCSYGFVGDGILQLDLSAGVFVMF
jgi:hypothetical protein